MTPLHSSDSHSTHPKVSRHHQQHETAEYNSALQGSNHSQAVPSDQLCREIPAHPASSHQSTLPIWLAANAGQDEQSCIRTLTTLEGNEVHRVEIGRDIAAWRKTQKWQSLTLCIIVIITIIAIIVRSIIKLIAIIYNNRPQ